jgi:hypothetical protein
MSADIINLSIADDHVFFVQGLVFLEDLSAKDIMLKEATKNLLAFKNEIKCLENCMIQFLKIYTVSLMDLAL